MRFGPQLNGARWGLRCKQPLLLVHNLLKTLSKYILSYLYWQYLIIWTKSQTSKPNSLKILVFKTGHTNRLSWFYSKSRFIWTVCQSNDQTVNISYKDRATDKFTLEWESSIKQTRMWMWWAVSLTVGPKQSIRCEGSQKLFVDFGEFSSAGIVQNSATVRSVGHTSVVANSAAGSGTCCHSVRETFIK